MLRNQQLCRLYYDSYQDVDSRPVITTRDVVIVSGQQRTRRILGKRCDLYPLNHENRSWRNRCDRAIHMGFLHDEDFVVVWDRNRGGLCHFRL